jgi:glycosyltransferase involved in cell wall biosynthesis
MTAPTLSVVMINFNHARFLPVSVGALVRQSLPATEIVFVDDASTDNSVKVIEDLARQHPTIHCFRNEKNLGVVGTCNRGLSLAKGQYVYFAAADDEVLPGFFEKSLTLLAGHPEAGLCCSIGQWHDVATGRNRLAGGETAGQPCYVPPSRMIELERAGKLLIATQTVIIKTAAIKAAGGMIPELKWYSDWFSQYVAGFREGICFVPEALTLFNLHPASYSRAGRSRKAITRDVLRHMLELFNRPEYSDAAELIRRSGALTAFGKPALRVMLGNPAFYRFLTPAFLRRTLASMARAEKRKWERSFSKRVGRLKQAPTT